MTVELFQITGFQPLLPLLALVLKSVGQALLRERIGISCCRKQVCIVSVSRWDRCPVLSATRALQKEERRRERQTGVRHGPWARGGIVRAGGRMPCVRPVRSRAPDIAHSPHARRRRSRFARRPASPMAAQRSGAASRSPRLFSRAAWSSTTPRLRSPTVLS